MTPPPRRAVLPLAAALCGIVILCVATTAFFLSRPRQPRTHTQNVRAALDRRAILYRSVELKQSYEESVELDTFRAQVQVTLLDGRVVSGWIGCEDRDSICFLELRRVGVVGERLPDLDENPPWPWASWFEALLRRAGLRRW